MVKTIERLLKNHKNSFNNRTVRDIKSLNRKCDTLIHDICQWYKIDDDEKIIIISNQETTNKDKNFQLLDLHFTYQNKITMNLHDILTKRDQLV